MTTTNTTRITEAEKNIVSLQVQVRGIDEKVDQQDERLTIIEKAVAAMSTDTKIANKKLDDIFKFLWLILGVLVSTAGGLIYAIIKHVLTGS